MLVDTIKIKFKAGKGGDGAVNFDKLRHPTGGDGGKGGDIYLKGSTSLYDLKTFRGVREIAAKKGENGGKAKRYGKGAEDVVINLPITSIIKDLDGNEIHRITKPGEQILITKGGIGGLGNFYFRRGQLLTREKFTEGKEGEEKDVLIELRLKADVILVGLPNAGKSSLLNALTNAKSKVAPYPFTTLEPHLAVAENYIFMDLPGFIEGVSEGKGVGNEFTSHMSSAKLVLHCISCESIDPLEDYNTIRKELEKMDGNIGTIKELVVLTKNDVASEAEIANKMALFSKKNIEITTVSILNVESLKTLFEKAKAILRSL